MPTARSSVMITLSLVLIPFALQTRVSAESASIDIAPQPTAIDLKCPRVVDRPLLIKVLRTNQGTLTVQSSNGARTVKQEEKDDMLFVDRITELDDALVKGEFAIVQANRTTNGKVSDLNSQGARLGYSFAFADSTARISTLNGRKIDQDELAELTQMVPGYSLPVDLPSDAQLEQTVSVDLFPVMRIALGTEAVLACPAAQLKIVAFDPKSGIAKLEGPASVEEQHPEGTVTYQLDATLEIATNDHRLTRAVFSGESKVEGDEIKGTGTHRFEISTLIGAAATSALDKEPTYRNTFRAMETLGLSLELASHWIMSPGEGGAVGFTRGLDTEGEESSIQLRRIAQVITAKDEKTFFSGVEGSFAKNSLEVISTSAVTLAGMKGKSYEMKQGESRVSFAAVIGKDAVFTLRFECPEAKYSTLRKEFESARSSLKPLAK